MNYIKKHRKTLMRYNSTILLFLFVAPGLGLNIPTLAFLKGIELNSIYVAVLLLMIALEGFLIFTDK